MYQNTNLLFRLVLLYLVTWAVTGCGITTPFTEEDWEKIFGEERNNYLYAVDGKDTGRINTLLIDDNTGKLTFKGSVLTTINYHLTSDLEGTTLFAAKGGMLSFFSVNNSGELLSQTDQGVPEEPRVMIIDYSGHFVYHITPPAINLYLYDKYTKTLTNQSSYTPQVAGTTVTIKGAAGGVKDNRLYLGVATTIANKECFYINTYAISPQNGALSGTAITTSKQLEVAPQKMCIHPSGRFLYTGNEGVASGNQISSLKINTDGSITPLASYAVIPDSAYILGEMIIDPAGRYLFATIQDPGLADLVCIFTIDDTTGLLTRCQKYSLNEKNLRCLATDPWGRYLYVGTNLYKQGIYMFKINNGTLTKLAENPYIYDPSGLTYKVEWLYSLSKKF